MRIEGDAAGLSRRPETFGGVPTFAVFVRTFFV